MSSYKIFDITGSGMTAQAVRMNTTASNIANANSVSSSVEQTYRGRHAVFAAELSEAKRQQGDDSVGVKVLGIVESDAPLNVEYSPNHPLADENGYIYKPNVNIMEEMANMISASRSYETNVQTAEAAKQMVMRTLRLGQQQ
ncbi:flagellar basal-body rod protein FlgC [Rheinheimera pacifica]|jgi:flagellar basal-body rod protein FlgC|uniref:Flagellar basal-body rod protein FlgC n=1 Tax=Rheinheimera pacifica TaxID=173990 RepID=A0A1H6MEJ7_9GAMM|nr:MULTISPECIES: flagellar basal body rod protein FlgC [Rheinheimera]MCS4309172.1 flagellar basal-body rod protein FlgC [Rheinheimera pacifica]MDR6983904.1 flagellar basal-body rod protein FlgC [Rheinheimera pacifica]PKM17388.1 MAG: flagellar basal body rod protein FlgC [Gammaproteobacteria bacterium HGW-Gammaproteobacteria-15]SEH99926.1 flagellar basal-body rod protein FlgC [Rheinheimera pacifica]